MEESKPRVLIVENEVALEARELERVLVADGYQVVGIAETGREAVEMARAHRPVVVLVDIELNDGEMAGAEAARTIQKEIGSQIIFVTGTVTKGIPNFWVELLKTPDHQFLTKPWGRAHLLALVRRAVVKAHSTKTVFLCYSRRDWKYANEWQEHMRPLHDMGIDSWVDVPQIPLGAHWREVLDQNLARASAAVCLVSIHSINSAFIRDVEWPVIRKAGLERGLPVIPVFVRAVDRAILERAGLLDFQSINPPEDPIERWPPDKRAQSCWAALTGQLQALMK